MELGCLVWWASQKSCSVCRPPRPCSSRGHPIWINRFFKPSLFPCLPPDQYNRKDIVVIHTPETCQSLGFNEWFMSIMCEMEFTMLENFLFPQTLSLKLKSIASQLGVKSWTTFRIHRTKINNNVMRSSKMSLNSKKYQLSLSITELYYAETPITIEHTVPEI